MLLLPRGTLLLLAWKSYFSPLSAHQYWYDAPVFLLNQVADDLVVEELHRLPLEEGEDGGDDGME